VTIAMGRIVPPIKLRSSAYPGLRKLSPDLINKAREETAAQVNRIGLTFLGTTAFCLLSLLSPDSALLGGSEKISVPLAGPVSFFGFILLGPAVLIMLRVYLQIYAAHSDRLDRLARSVPLMRAPTLVSLKNPLIRIFSGLTFYLLLPVSMILFAWKAAVFPAWGSGLLCVAVGIIASHAVLPLDEVSWRSKALLSVSAGIIAAGLIFGFGPIRRPFNLYHANLSNQLLQRADLSGADLREADLSQANLSNADLSNADLRGTNLRGALLRGTILISANLAFANLSDADLLGARMWDASLSSANLSHATLRGTVLRNARLLDANLSGANLYGTNLHGANLSGADLRDAVLDSAELSGAKLLAANLSKADLTDADLSGADLTSADLSGADLSISRSLTQRQLDLACGSEQTKLLEGLTLRPCMR
jgi:uncharacterized protein YjbI with pentapeptide repeats